MQSKWLFTAAVPIVVVLMGAIGCQQEPVLEGAPLGECSPGVHSTCPNDLRCNTASVCVVNSSPQVSIVPPGESNMGAQVTIIANASDPDGDDLTYAWTQNGSSIPGTQSTLTTTLGAVGFYTFGVTVDDGLATQFTETVVTITDAQIAYVSTNGNNGAGCGSISNPCLTVTHGIGLGRAKVFVAAGVYNECIALSGTTMVRGALNPDTWAHEPGAPQNLRADTRILCDTNQAHVIDGTAKVETLTLGSTWGGQANTTTTPEDAATVFVPQNAQPTLTDIDVESPPCSEQCTSIGISLDRADANINNVNIRATAVGFSVLLNFIGIKVVGGNPVVTGTRSTSRGDIIMNVPVIGFAKGIYAVQSNLSVQGMGVFGGLGVWLSGIEAHGGQLDAQANVIDIDGFGSNGLFGINVNPCGPKEQEPCIVQGAPESAVATIRNGNEIILTGGNPAVSLIPCAAVGIMVKSGRTLPAPKLNCTGSALDANCVTISDNTVSVLQSHNLVFGISAEDIDSISSNTIQVDGGVAQEHCEQLFIDLFGANLASAIGINLSGQNVNVQSNTITVEAHEISAVGLVANDKTGEGYRIESNTITVGQHKTGTEVHITADAYGASLQAAAGSQGSAESWFVRNHIRIGNDPINGTGLVIEGAGSFRVENNFIYGGDGYYGTGLSVIKPDATIIGATVPQLADGYPAIRHNTIFGGGLRGATLQSTAMLVLGVGAKSITTNNLLDAGNGLGNQIILTVNGDNFGAGLGNYGQFSASTLSAPGAFAVYGGWPPVLATGSVPPTPSFAVALKQSGMVLQLDANGDIMEGARTGGPIEAFWGGLVGGKHQLVAIVPDYIAILRDQDADSFERYRTVSYENGFRDHTPERALAANRGIYFIDRISPSASGTLWLMPRRFDGFGAPVQQNLSATNATLTNAVAFETGGGGADLYILDLDTTQTPTLWHTIGKKTETFGFPAGTSFTNVRSLEVTKVTMLFTDTTELLIQADGVLSIWKIPSSGIALTSIPLLDNSSTNPLTPCQSSTILTASQIDLIRDAGVLELVVTCADNSIESYQRLGNGKYVLLHSPNFTEPTMALATLTTTTTASCLSPPNSTGIWMMGITDTGMTEIFAGNGTSICTATSSALPSNIEVLNIADSTVSNLANLTPATLTNPICTLYAHGATSTAPFNLHLDDSTTSNACADKGAVLSTNPISDDIDAAGTRTDGSLDIGADEI